MTSLTNRQLYFEAWAVLYETNLEILLSQPIFSFVPPMAARSTGSYLVHCLVFRLFVLGAALAKTVLTGNEFPIFTTVITSSTPVYYLASN